MTDWNANASTAIVVTAGQPPPAAVLSFAMVQGAVYDAVNAIDRGHRSYLPQPPAAAGASEDAAAATAALPTCWSSLFPLQQSTLDGQYRNVAGGDPGYAAGREGGRDRRRPGRGAAMIAARANDGRGGPFTPVIGTTPGAWRPTPPAFALDPSPWVGNVRPFVVPNVAMLRSAGPNPLTSRAYAKDFNEVKAIGALHSTTRTPDQTDAAIFWQDHAFALWNRVFRTLAADHNLATADSARLLATTNLAAADAAIGCWNNKYHYNSWRPITAIREADTDGNPATTADPKWTPLFDPATPVAAGQAPLVTPPFPETHPATTAPPVPSSPPCATSLAPTTSASPPPAINPGRPGPSTACQTRCRRTSTPGSGPGSTSAPPTVKASSSGPPSRATSTTTTSNPRTTITTDPLDPGARRRAIGGPSRDPSSLARPV